jgi:mannosylfructose-phosphate synthase
MQQTQYNSSILMMSLHGYVEAEPEFGKPDTGGQVVYVLELAKRFSRLGHYVDLVTRRFEGQPEFDEINEHLRIWRIPFGGDEFIRKEDMHDYLGDFVTNALMSIRDRGRQYNVVYSHYWDAGWAGQKIAEELVIPHVHTPHSLGWWKQHNMGADMDPELMEERYRFEERIRKEFLVYRTCDHIIATTIPQDELLREHYDVLERHITVIPPGIDENRFSPVRQEEKRDLQARYGVSPNGVLAVGRMAANKGHDLLIEALPTLISLVPDARLIAGIGGDESEQDEAGVAELQKLAKKLKVDDRIDWVRYIADEDLPNYYRAHGGLAELIDFGTQALYADPNRAAEYGAVLALPMLYPNLADELSVEGSRFARRNFGWTGIAKRILEVFDRARSMKYEDGR